MEYTKHGYPVCPADDIMRKNEGNMSVDEYAESMGLKKPDEEKDGWFLPYRSVVIFLAAIVVLMLLSSCSTGMTLEDRRELGRDFCHDQSNIEKKNEVRKMMDDYVIDGFGGPTPDMIFFMGIACARSEMV